MLTNKRSFTSWLLEIIALVALAAAFIIVAQQWTRLPAKIPTHFGASGKPNGWGGKSSLWFLLFIDAVTYTLLTAASKYQRLINIPLHVDRGAPEVQQILSSMVAVLKAVLMLVFLYLIAMSVEVALGRANGLQAGFVGVLVAAPLVILAVYMARLWRYRQ
jgi:uncharacterized membrane protein